MKIYNGYVNALMKRFIRLLFVSSTLIFWNSAEAVIVEEVPLTNLSKKETALIHHVKSAIAQAEAGNTDLDSEVLNIQGYSGKKVKYLLNHLCKWNNAVFLEIGCLRGSTLCAAVRGNELPLKHVFAVDNWSEFGGPRDQFFQNIIKFIPKARLTVIEKDCFALPLSEVFKYPVDIYFYDGDHSYNSQRMAFTYFEPIFNDVFVAIVDDWRWDDTFNGTLHGIEEAGYQVLFREDLYRQSVSNNEGYWNGLCVMVLKKPAIHTVKN